MIEISLVLTLSVAFWIGAIAGMLLTVQIFGGKLHFSYVKDKKEDVHES